MIRIFRWEYYIILDYLGWPNVITKGLQKWKRETKEASVSDRYDARKETDPC